MPKGITSPSKISSIRTLMGFHLAEHALLAITIDKLEKINNRYLESQMDLDNIERIEKNK